MNENGSRDTIYDLSGLDETGNYVLFSRVNPTGATDDKVDQVLTNRKIALSIAYIFQRFVLIQPENAIWKSRGGNKPLDHPPCGWDGHLCPTDQGK